MLIIKFTHTHAVSAVDANNKIHTQKDLERKIERERQKTQKKRIQRTYETYPASLQPEDENVKLNEKKWGEGERSRKRGDEFCRTHNTRSQSQTCCLATKGLSVHHASCALLPCAHESRHLDILFTSAVLLLPYYVDLYFSGDNTHSVRVGRVSELSSREATLNGTCMISGRRSKRIARDLRGTHTPHARGRRGAWTSTRQQHHTTYYYCEQNVLIPGFDAAEVRTAGAGVVHRGGFEPIVEPYRRRPCGSSSVVTALRVEREEKVLSVHQFVLHIAPSAGGRLYSGGGTMSRAGAKQAKYAKRGRSSKNRSPHHPGSSKNNRVFPREFRAMRVYEVLLRI